MALEIQPLSPAHREIARSLWEELNHAENSEALLRARARLVDAPEEVRTAILRVNIEQWQRDSKSVAEKNPFFK